MLLSVLMIFQEKYFIVNIFLLPYPKLEEDDITGESEFLNIFFFFI